MSAAALALRSPAATPAAKSCCNRNSSPCIASACCSVKGCLRMVRNGGTGLSYSFELRAVSRGRNVFAVWAVLAVEGALAGPGAGASADAGTGESEALSLCREQLVINTTIAARNVVVSKERARCILILQAIFSSRVAPTLVGE